MTEAVGQSYRLGTSISLNVMWRRGRASEGASAQVVDKIGQGFSLLQRHLGGVGRPSPPDVAALIEHPAASPELSKQLERLH
jgi:hypothetical protein